MLERLDAFPMGARWSFRTPNLIANFHTKMGDIELYKLK